MFLCRDYFGMQVVVGLEEIEGQCLMRQIVLPDKTRLTGQAWWRATGMKTMMMVVFETLESPRDEVSKCLPVAKWPSLNCYDDVQNCFLWMTIVGLSSLPISQLARMVSRPIWTLLMLLETEWKVDVWKKMLKTFWHHHHHRHHSHVSPLRRHAMAC